MIAYKFPDGGKGVTEWPPKPPKPNDGEKQAISLVADEPNGAEARSNRIGSRSLHPNP